MSLQPIVDTVNPWASVASDAVKILLPSLVTVTVGYITLIRTQRHEREKARDALNSDREKEHFRRRLDRLESVGQSVHAYIIAAIDVWAKHRYRYDAARKNRQTSWSPADIEGFHEVLSKGNESVNDMHRAEASCLMLGYKDLADRISDLRASVADLLNAILPADLSIKTIEEVDAKAEKVRELHQAALEALSSHYNASRPRT